MRPLKLVALDEEDLEVLSAHLQDAVLRVGDMTYVPGQKRFAAIANRFDWESAAKGGKDGKKRFERRRSALRFDRALDVQVRGINQNAPDSVLELLAIRFEESDKPSGYVNLVFAGGGAVRIQVECIEAELKDLGPVWRTRRMPRHEEEEDAEPQAKS